MRFVPPHRRHFREMLTASRRCPCGAEYVRRGQCIGPACYAAAPANLRREVYSKDVAVVRAAWQSLKDFAKRNAALQPAGLGNLRLRSQQSSIT